MWHIALSQILTLDAMLAGWLAVAFAALVFAQRAEANARQRRNAMWLAWAALAAATLTKGLIGAVIPGAAVVLYTIVTRDIALWRRMHVGSGLLLYFALAAPWFVVVSRTNPEFAEFFFVHEHVERFLTTEHRRTGTIAYFVPLFCAGALPWLTILVFETRRAWR